MLFAATWMDLEVVIRVKLVKDKLHRISLICGILKGDTDKPICRIETDSQTLKANLWLPKGTGMWWGGWPGGVALAYAQYCT